MIAKPFPSLAFAALLAGGVAIGFAGIMVRLSDVSPLASAFWRLALAAPLLWVWAAASASQDKSQGKRTEFSWPLFLSGAYFAGDMAIWHLSLHNTTVANATLLSNFAPLFIALWLGIVLRVKFSRLFLCGMALALVGAALLIGPNLNMSAAEQAGRLWGDAFGLGSAIFYAAYQLAIKDARNAYSTARLMAWSSTITALCLLPLALLAPGQFFPAELAGWLPLIGLALIAQIGGQTVIAYALAHLPASLSSVSLLVQPLTAAIAAWILFNEALGPVRLLGAALLLAGIWLSRRGS